MIAVVMHEEVVLAGVAVPAHRTLEVVDDLDADAADEGRAVLTAGQARALVQAGVASPIEADFTHAAELIERWQRA